MSIAANLREVRDRIARAESAAGQPPGAALLVAVSKTKTVERIREAVAAGQLLFGENYAQELRDKMQLLPDPAVRWHFIGQLQKNKVKYVAGKAYEIHTIDDADLALEVGRRSAAAGVRQRVLLEVNVGGEAAKSGVAPEAAAELAEAVRGMAGLELVGLMTMPPFFPDPEGSRPFYRELRELRDRLRERLRDPAALPELSMGLSHDFEVAVAEGATRVRVGTAIFGERERREE